MGQQAIAPLDLDGRQYGALALLSHRGPCSQQELADALYVDRSTMVALVDDLEARSLLKRRRSPSDRRAYAIELTAAGTRLQRSAQALLERCERDFLASLGTDEQQQLGSLLQRLREDGG